MSTAGIGTVVESVGKWDPRKQATGDFTYIDLSAIDQQQKLISGPAIMPMSEAPSRARQLVATGDVLVSTVRPNLNAVAQVPPSLDGATASTGFCVLRPSEGQLDGRYLFHWIQSGRFIDEMVRLATGASYPAVSDKIVKASCLPLPPIEEQRRIAAILDAADALRAKRRQAIAKLDSLTQAIFIDMFGDPLTNPKGWAANHTLKDVADARSGITKGRKTGDAQLTTVPYLAVVNVQDGFIEMEPLKSIDATDKELERYRLVHGDILLTEGGDPDKLGRGAVWTAPVDPCIHQNHVFRVRVTDEKVTPEFLSRLLGSTRGKRYFLRMAKQTTGIASINMTQLRNFPILEPPLSLQKEYLSRTADVDQQRALVDRSATELDQLFASLQQRAFRGEL